MSRLIDKRSSARRSACPAALAAVLALLIGAGSAFAGPDQLKGGSASLQLQSSRGMKLKPRALTLPITAGEVDPVNGSGTVVLSGSFKAKRGKGKTKVKITALTLGAGGGPGIVSAKVGKSFVRRFATLRAGTVARSGWGATISNIRATIASRGAQA